MEPLAYVKVEVGGIQNFIAGNGKLREMIGGSQIIFQICQPDFYRDALAEIGCDRELDAPGKNADWHIVTQNNAGTLCLVLPGRDKAKRFLNLYSRKALENFPGLPLYGAQAPMSWWDRESFGEARREVENLVGASRASKPAPAGMPMAPVARPARLDGLPAAGKDKDEYISLVSLCRRNPDMLQASENRLRELVRKTDYKIEWADDLEKLKDGTDCKVALIHMDGNDLGKMFADRLNKTKDLPPEQGIRDMKNLSALIEKANREAFAHAAAVIADYMMRESKATSLVMPLRPLVMGGDDITLIARADIALAFIDLFSRRFERVGAEAKLSLGIGMVVMDSSWPFAKAFTLAESLLESAKHSTLNMYPRRPSSLDYVVLTEETENNVDALRRRVYTAADGASLTGKPLSLAGDSLAAFINDGMEVLDNLPRSAMRQALTDCRKGANAAERRWLNALENIKRGLGGRAGKKLMDANRFKNLFPENFFVGEGGHSFTRLGDYLELERLLPVAESRAMLLEALLEGRKMDV